jgi:hypothetical protein
VAASPSADDLSLDDLRRASFDELERLYAEARPLVLPKGSFRGHHLGWLDTRGARHPLFRPIETIGFERIRFGVDFDRRCWFFVQPWLALGRFEPHLGASRWRHTDTVQLRYHVSRLPGPIRRILYDEVKPLGPDLCLGIGGINARVDRGDHFFFALAR